MESKEQLPQISYVFSQPLLNRVQNLDLCNKLSVQEKGTSEHSAKKLNSSNLHYFTINNCEEISEKKSVTDFQQPSKPLTLYLSPVISFWNIPSLQHTHFLEYVYQVPYFGPIQNYAEDTIQSSKDQNIPTHYQNVTQFNKKVSQLNWQVLPDSEDQLKQEVCIILLLNFLFLCFVFYSRDFILLVIKIYFWWSLLPMVVLLLFYSQSYNWLPIVLFHTFMFNHVYVLFLSAFGVLLVCFWFALLCSGSVHQFSLWSEI